MEPDYAPLSQSCYRALTDKMYDKRKMAASEIDKMVRDFVQSDNTSSLEQLLSLFTAMCQSPNTNIVKGGLMGIGAMAVSMGPITAEAHCGPMVDAVLPCFVRPADARVRYYACESLYNVCKAVRCGVTCRFNAIWCAMAQLKVDVDNHVRDGGDVLDRLLMDVVVESRALDMAAFMTCIRQHIYSDERVTRQLVVTWMTHLHSLTHVRVTSYLCDTLDGLFCILADNDESLYASCESLLQRLLDSVVRQHSPPPSQQQQLSPSGSQLDTLVNVLLVHVTSGCARVQRLAVCWLRAFSELPSPASCLLLPHLASLLHALLPCLAYSDDERRATQQSAKTLSYTLLQMVATRQVPVSRLAAVVDVLCSQLESPTAVPVQVAALKWLQQLQEMAAEALSPHSSRLFSVLLHTLSDPSDEVLRLDVQVLAEVCSSHSVAETVDCGHLEQVMTSLLGSLESSPGLLESRSTTIVRQLCVILSAEQIFCTLAQALAANANVTFVARMVRQLNSILMTSVELFEVRAELQRGGTESSVLFGRLYPVWCYSPVSALALCLLTGHHQVSLSIVQALGQLEITVELLVELDSLVQLLETPVFAQLRLNLLRPWRFPQLLDTLYAVLMILPQTEAFALLRQRLDCVPYHRMLRGLALTPSRPPLDHDSEGSDVEGQGGCSDTDAQQLIGVFRQACDRFRQFRRGGHQAPVAAKVASSQ